MDFDTHLLSSNDLSFHNPTKQKCFGFGFFKQDRAINEEGEEEDLSLREFKMSKTSSEVPRYPLQRSNGCGAEGHQQQMLSFSSPTSHPLTLPYYHYTSNAFGRNTGINGVSMQQQQGVRGPFTASQWMELEHQALIYKYLTANVPIPSYLLNPIRKAFESVGFSVLRSSALGWGGFQLGSDPEPGRCRRTDGKKWRCSRDAVVDQKYCERHMNRGRHRHRSRKPVEPNPTSVTQQLTTTNSLAASTTTTSNPNHLSATAAGTGIPTMTRGEKEVDQNAFQEFGLVCSDSLINPLVSSTKYNDDHNTKSQLRQFMDAWPNINNQLLNEERTQLSISIPMARDLEMGLGVGGRSWGSTSMGGPLGEALHNTTKQLNLIDTWDNSHSPGLASSPTGVLHSLSNSSAASSPRSNHCNGIINPSLPAL